MKKQLLAGALAVALSLGAIASGASMARVEGPDAQVGYVVAKRIGMSKEQSEAAAAMGATIAVRQSVIWGVRVGATIGSFGGVAGVVAGALIGAA